MNSPTRTKSEPTNTHTHRACIFRWKIYFRWLWLGCCYLSLCTRCVEPKPPSPYSYLGSFLMLFYSFNYLFALFFSFSFFFCSTKAHCCYFCCCYSWCLTNMLSVWFSAFLFLCFTSNSNSNTFTHCGICTNTTGWRCICCVCQFSYCFLFLLSNTNLVCECVSFSAH